MKRLVAALCAGCRSPWDRPIHVILHHGWTKTKRGGAEAFAEEGWILPGSRIGLNTGGNIRSGVVENRPIDNFPPCCSNVRMNPEAFIADWIEKNPKGCQTLAGAVLYAYFSESSLESDERFLTLRKTPDADSLNGELIDACRATIKTARRRQLKLPTYAGGFSV